MKRVLLLMPSFMGYDTALKQELEKKYYVRFINNELYRQDYFDLYFASIFRKALHKLIKSSCEWDRKRIEKQFTNKYLDLIKEEEEFDYVLCINGHYLPDDFYDKIKNRYNKAKFVLYLWDDVSNLYKTSHFRWFDTQFSYNKDDCQINGFDYLSMFVQSSDVELSSEKKYDICVVGTAHPSRMDFVEKLYNKYKDKYSFYIYMCTKNVTGAGRFFTHDEPLSYKEYIKVLSESKAVLDCPHEKQQGPTTRFSDAELAKTKVITTNPNIEGYSFDHNNILIIDRSNPIIDTDFLDRAYDEDVRRVMGIADWINNTIRE